MEGKDMGIEMETELMRGWRCLIEDQVQIQAWEREFWASVREALKSRGRG